MSKPVFEDVFALSGRRNRKSYLLFGLLVLVIDLVVWGIAFAINSSTIFWVAGLLSLPITVASILVAAQRCRDFGWTGWAVLIMLIPYIGGLFGLAILFIPGNRGANRYGPDPIG